MFFLLALVLTALVGLSGCSEKETTVIVDADEIIRYIGETEDTRELFRTSGLINPDNYSVPFDSGMFRDSLLRHARLIQVFLVPLKVVNMSGDSVPNDPDRIYAEYGGYIGRVRECLAKVEDKFTIQTSRTYADTTLFDTAVLTLERYAFFLKLGDDNKPYVGWTLWGYNGVGTVAPPLGVTIKSSSGAEFRGDLGLYRDKPKSRLTAIPNISYLFISDMDTITSGSRVLVTATKASPVQPSHQLLSGLAVDGTFTRSMRRYDNIDFIDSLWYQTPATSSRRFELMLLQTLYDTAFPARSGFVVPFKQ